MSRPSSLFANPVKAPSAKKKEIPLDIYNSESLEEDGHGRLSAFALASAAVVLEMVTLDCGGERKIRVKTIMRRVRER